MKIIIGLAALLLVMLFVFMSLPDGRLKVFFLDVGQGDSALIISPSGKKVLIDTGPQNNVLLPLGKKLSYFTRYIDLVFITHPDQDHAEGLVEILRRYKVGAVVLPVAFKELASYEVIIKEAEKQNVPVVFADADKGFLIEENLVIDVLYPAENAVYFTDKSNLHSVVLQLDYMDSKILFTGDVTEEQEKEMLSMGINIDAEILKVPHHGSKSSSSEVFIKAVSPEYAMISCGENNPFGHPHTEVLERYNDFGAEVLRTDEMGSVGFYYDDEFKLL